MNRTKLILSAITIISGILAVGCGKSQEGLVGPDGYGRTSLSNGIPVLLNNDSATALTAVRILIGGGVAIEQSDKNGISNLMIKMLLKGNERMSADEITERLDFLGASISAECFRDFTAISFVCLSENLPEVLSVISQCLLTPTFPTEQLAKLKDEVKSDIRSETDDQELVASKLLWRTMYGDRGYGLPLLGTAETVDRMTADDLKDHFEKLSRTGNMIIAVSSDLSPDSLSALMEKEFGSIRSGDAAFAKPELTPQSGKEDFIKFDRNQSFIFIGYPLAPMTIDEAVDLITTQEILGYSSAGRLWPLRQKEHLAYSVYAQYALDKYDVMIRAAIGTDTSKVQTALASLKRELKKLYDEGINDEELINARINMKNNMFYRIDRKGARANNMAYFEYIGYGYKFPFELIERIDRISVESVNRFIKANLNPERQHISIVGKK